MAAALGPSPVNFHLSLNVANLERSIAFFSTVFNMAPSKCRVDYAKFEVANPPLTLALEPSAPEGRGALNHIGFRFANSLELVDMQRRLEIAGMSSQREEGVECCYSKQTKFWLNDPDGNLWEFYVLDSDIEHRGEGQTQSAVTNPSTVPAQKSTDSQQPTWRHRLGEPLPSRIPLSDGEAAAVQLMGTFNSLDVADRRVEVLAEAARVLAPGGRLTVHCLTAEAPIHGELHLPGPAAVVSAVPVDAELLADIQEAGFVATSLTKFGSLGCFEVNGVSMRETMVQAFAPSEVSSGDAVVLLYKGPGKALVLDGGVTLERGVRTETPAAVWASIAHSPLAEQIVQLQTLTSSCGV